MDFYDNNEIVDLWTTEFLQDLRPARTAEKSSHVAFGRTSSSLHKKEKKDHQIRPKTTPNNSDRNKPKISLIQPTKVSGTREQQTNEYLSRISGQQSKVRGTQMLNFKINLSKAQEKRQRQLAYSREIRSGAKSFHMREIDSVTRIVVNSFRNLIDCERCALFLMDDSTNELYFKPVGGDTNHSHARLKEIRFPATAGVAGWVATNKLMLNIKNAYKDARFNSDIDKKTGFRTRTILCHPVLDSSKNQLLGVIQMVNKKKSNPLVLRGANAKKGYQSSFESFNSSDEEILGKCCSEVSKSLIEIFAHRRKQNEFLQSGDKSKVLVADEEGTVSSPQKLMSRIRPSVVIRPATSSKDKPHSVGEARDDTSSVEQSTETDSMSYIPDPPPRRRTSRRSSVGQLTHFVKRNSMTNDKGEENGDIQSATHSGGITEAVKKFQFRSQDSERLKEREEERRLRDSEYLLAKSKRNRRISYSGGCQQRNKL